MLIESGKEKISSHKRPFQLTEIGFKFSPEFEREVRVDSMIFDWLNTVQKVEIFGQKHEFPDARFDPLISLMRVFGIERHKSDPQQNRLVEILSSAEPTILLIHGHGIQPDNR
jgi:hypothetical protein